MLRGADEDQPDRRWELTADERARVDTEGFLVRHDVFDADEVTSVAGACEDLVRDVVAGRAGSRMKAGSYVFDPDFARGLMIKWEGDSDVVHGLEPFAHLSEPLRELAADERFVGPMRTLCGTDEPMLFTEKLNLKRAGVGGANPLHRDYPYWRDATPRAAEIATAILFLDDADHANGCLEVVPGSHLAGEWSGRDDPNDYFAQHEIDTDQIDLDALEVRSVEVGAGSMLFLGSHLVHRSAPNTSDRDRRALLYSYQPPVEPCPTQLDLLRRLAAGSSA